jgi:hypothetical protein
MYSELRQREARALAEMTIEKKGGQARWLLVDLRSTSLWVSLGRYTRPALNFLVGLSR